jgi:glyoxylase-like metal-dependent hydrolase (beta-lactamase superfamily II)
MEYIRAKKPVAAAAALVAFVALAQLRAQQTANPDAVIDAAAAALGASGLRSIQYAGWGSDYIFGQGYDGTYPWPRFTVPAMTVAIDFTTLSFRDDRRRTQAENPPLGGGFQPMVGEQRQIWLLSGGYAWDLVGGNAVAAAVERDMRSAVQGRTTQIWLTPHGFIKAAQAGNARVRTDTVRGAKKTVISVTMPMNVTLEGTLNEQGLVEHVETWTANPVLGDMKIEASFSGYKDFGGVKFPTRIVQRSGGYPILDLTVAEVMPNAAFSLDVPAAIRQPAAAPAALVAERVSDGVWIVPGGAKSVVVEFRDHVIVVEAPESETRSAAVIEAVKKAIPGKRVGYVINTHSHFDHAGGLRTYAAEGATIVTHTGNIPFYQQVWANPRTINPDRLARSGGAPVFEGIAGGNRTFRDDTREMLVYHLAGNMHNPGLLMVYLPKERILVEADSYTPTGSLREAPGGVANLAQFYDRVERLGLDVEQIIPIHGRLTTLAEAKAYVEAFGRTQIFR